jgi:hypothetical protein
MMRKTAATDISDVKIKFTGNGQGPQEAFKQSHVIFKSHDSYY